MENQTYAPQFQIQQSATRLRHLQAQHKQLQQCLNQRKHSLLLHSKMLNQMQSQSHKSIDHQNQRLIQQLFKRQQEIQFAYADMLINGQIRIQQQLQYRDLIRQYQNRILQLRTVMIDKEVQLVGQMQTKKKQFMPTKDRLKMFHQAQSQQNNIRKLLQQYQSLANQVSNLQDQYRLRSQKTKDSSQTDQDHFQLGALSTLKKSSGMSVIRNQPQGAIFKDRLLHKVFGLLQQQLQTQKKLKQEYQMLKKQYQQCSYKHKGLIKKYKEDQYDGGKILEQEQYEQAAETLQQIPENNDENIKININLKSTGVFLAKDPNIMISKQKSKEKQREKQGEKQSKKRISNNNQGKMKYQSISNFYKKGSKNKRLSCQN